MFIHLIEGSKKYDAGISEDGFQQLQDDVMYFKNNTIITVADVVKKLQCKFMTSTVYLYNEHGSRLQNTTKVEHARVYTIRRKPISYDETEQTGMKKRKRSEMKNGDEDTSTVKKDDEEPKSKESCRDRENVAIEDWENKYNNFEVYCCPGEQYDFSSIEYNNVIDGELRDIKANTPYPITNIQRSVKKYDIDTDRIDEVNIMSLQTANGSFRIVAPYALIEYCEMIEDKLYHDTTLVIFRKEKGLIHVFVK